MYPLRNVEFISSIMMCSSMRLSQIALPTEYTCSVGDGLTHMLVWYYRYAAASHRIVNDHVQPFIIHMTPIKILFLWGFCPPLLDATQHTITSVKANFSVFIKRSAQHCNKTKIKVWSVNWTMQPNKPWTMESVLIVNIARRYIAVYVI